MEEETDAREVIPFDEFRRIVAEELHIDRDKVVREASFVDDLFADSIQLVELMLRLEEIGITIPIDSAWEVETVGDAYHLYRDHAVPNATGESPARTSR
jgi:acyl carrier protein